MKARVYLLGLVVFCSACAAPSLRYKSEVNHLLAQGQFKAAGEKVAAKSRQMYAKQDNVLADLDQAVLLHDAGFPQESDKLLARAQDRIQELYTTSVSKSTARLLVNDLTLPYDVANYERAYTYFYRAMNFLDVQNLTDAAVEARKASAFLDALRGGKKQGYNDDPFVQYFSSLIFESVGQRSDARLCRDNSLKAYQNLSGLLQISAPEFTVPVNADELGEVILLHYNGLLPLKKTETVQLSWNRIWAILDTSQETRNGLPPQVENALRTGWMGHAVTLSFPALEPQPYTIVSSFVQVGGQRYRMQKMADLSAAAKADLEERLPGIWFRTATRAVTKQIAAEQARQAARSSSKEEGVGELAGLFINILGATLEKADTRQWFTLPAQIFMTRLFLPPGSQNIQLLFRDGYGNIVGEHTFENVRIERGKRVFLHYRTAR